MAFTLLNRFIFSPMRYPHGAWEVQNASGARDAELRARDGVRLHAWWFPTGQPNLASLFLHGNAGNVTHRIEHALALNQAGSSVLVIDYRGYGKSCGQPSELGVYLDAEAGYEWLTNLGFSRDSIVLHGESIGTAVASELACRRHCAALILESPFTSISAMANRVVPFLGGLFIRGYDTLSRIKNISVRKLIIHGEADDIVPISHGNAVFDAASEPKAFWAIPQAGHNDLLQVAGDEYTRRLTDFYQTVTSNRTFDVRQY